MQEPPDKVRLEALFEGRVQGVGFRYHTCKVACEFEVSGFVENLPDGRVRLVAEGSPAETDAFLDEVRDQLSHFIKNVATDIRPVPSPAFKGFELR